MHNKDISLVNCFPSVMEQKLNEPEEGEIVDEYELISSDEELCMRQRIRELEEENAEIEQIAVISRSYDIERAARIPTDASSISSTEFKTPKKRKRHKNKEHKKKTCQHHHSTGHHRHQRSTSHAEKKTNKSRKTRCKRREKLLHKKQTKTSHKDMRDNLNFDSSDSLKSSISSLSLTESESSVRHISTEDAKEDIAYYKRSEIRNTLRLAVARSRKNSARQSGHNVDLKERLLRKDLEFTGNQFSTPTNVIIREDNVDEEDDDVVICEPENEIQSVPDDSEDSLEERELRLIALKSAVLKKHMDRKKRNAEAAYSPTDFDDIISSCVVDSETKLADLEVVDLDEDDSQNGCPTASPIASPQLMMLDGNDDSSHMVDCKPIDMDIANSDSEDCPPAPPVNWNAELPTSVSFPPYPPNDLSSTYPYSLYLSEYGATTINPPPPGVDDYEEMKEALNTNHGKSHDVEAQDMEVENDEFEPIETYPTTCDESNKEIDKANELKLNSNTTSLHSNPMDEDTQEEEEEQALRALLLSKFNSPKNQKKNANTLSCTAEVNKENSLEHEANKDFSANTVKPTEAILKEAVKRLKVVGRNKEENRQEQLFARKEYISYGPSAIGESQQQTDGTDEIPLPPRIYITLENSTHSEENAEVATMSLKCLKRKVDELKNHKEPEMRAFIAIQNKQSERTMISDHTNTHNMDKNMGTLDEETKTYINSNLEVDKTTDLRISPSNTNGEKCRDPLTSLDEDTKRRLQKLKNDIICATLGKNVEPSQEIEIQSEIQSTVYTENLQALNLPVNESIEIISDTKPIVVLNNKDTSTQSINDAFKADKSTKEVESKVVAMPKTKSTNSNVNKITTDICLTKTALKENNLNNVNKNSVKSSSAVVASIKSTQESKKLVRIVNKTTVSVKNKDTEPVMARNSTQTFTKSLPIGLKSSVIKPLPTYSVLRTTKIVKPNKVINKNVDLKRKVVLIKSDTTASTASKVVKTEPTISVRTAAPAKSPVDTSRLITSMDQVRSMCSVPQLVISVQNSSNESSADEWGDCDSMYKPSYDYNDISSPLSLNLESPCHTPTRSNSPIEDMEEKANKLIKPKRSPIIFSKETNTAPKTPINAKPTKSMEQTPVAVRHLPSAAQDEYRKLINRMKLLENQRNKKDNTKPSSDSVRTNKETSDTNAITSAVKPTLVKQVLLRNTNNKSNTPTVTASAHKPTSCLLQQSVTPKPHKSNVLRTYECLYVKIGAGIIKNLDKSISLVDEAKKAKINKLKLEVRLKKLKAEMELLQARHKEEEQKIAHIYPSICSTNDVITSMKQKRSKVFKAALTLGRTLKGEDYRLNNELKQSITNKSKKLATEIKMVNSLKADDIDRLLLEDANAKAVENNKMEEKIKGENGSCESEKSIMSNGEKALQQEVLQDPKSNVLDGELHNPKDNSVGLTSLAEPEDVSKPTNSLENGNHTEALHDDQKADNLNNRIPSATNGVNTEFQDREMTPALDTTNTITVKEEIEDLRGDGEDTNCDEAENDSKGLLSYTSPLDHMRNINGCMDPNGVVCPYDLMGNCEDTSCKYVHITQQRDKDPKDNTNTDV